MKKVIGIDYGYDNGNAMVKVIECGKCGQQLIINGVEIVPYESHTCLPPNPLQ